MPFRFPFILLLSLLFVGCADPTNEPDGAVFECADDEDCRDGQACVRASDGRSTTCEVRTDADAADTTSPADTMVDDTSEPNDTSRPDLGPPDTTTVDTMTDTNIVDTNMVDTTSTDTSIPSGCGGACTGALMCCSDQCVDIKANDHHCGACGNTCNASTRCCEGGCGGTADQTCCPGVGWVDLSRDNQHCGTCSTTCSADAFCEDGLCLVRVALDGNTATPEFATIRVGHAVVFQNITFELDMLVSLSLGVTSPEIPPLEFWPYFPETPGEIFFSEQYGGAAGVITVE